jgi:hypothetical protein
MRKIFWLAIVVVLLAAGGYAGMLYGKQYVADKVMDQVVAQVMQDEEIRKLFDDPDVRQALRDAAAGEDWDRLSGELSGRIRASGGSGAAAGGSGGQGAAGSGPAGGKANGAAGDSSGGKPLVVSNVDEAEALVLDKFSIGEIRRYAGMASGGLTEEEKAVLLEEVKGKFTDEEWHALKIVALIEAEKRRNE